MMPGYIEVIRVEDRNRRDLFQQAAQRMGAPPANVEKDFWVCLILDALFNWPLDGGARLLFKGGTSLAKAYGLISRFSEDIDVTVFREDLGEPGDAAALGALSRNQRERRLEAMKVACHRYIVDRLLPHLRDEVLASTFEMARRPFTPTSVTLDVDDDQTILFAYPTVVEEDDGYVRRVVKIEMGAKSALDPHDLVTIRPFIAADMGDIPFDVRGVRTIHPVRTFWDKLYIAHETRERFETRGQMQGGGQRLSRHYYDLHRLLGSDIGSKAIADLELGADCLRHRRAFFPAAKGGSSEAGPGTFRLMPTEAMLPTLREDYARMGRMIFGEPPGFEDVMGSIREIERRLNHVPRGP